MTIGQLLAALGRLEHPNRWVEDVYSGYTYCCALRVSSLIDLWTPEDPGLQIVNHVPHPFDHEEVTPYRITSRRSGIYGQPCYAIHWRLTEPEPEPEPEPTSKISWLKEGF